MASIEELKAERIKKIKILEENNVNPYPAKYSLSGKRVSTVQAKEMLEEKEVSEEIILLMGRILTIRGSGKIIFIDLIDEKGKFQIVPKADILSLEKLNFFSQTADMGDFFGFNGKLFITARGEKSLEAIDFEILSKAILPLPSQWYGLENEEEAIRKRYLDLLLHPEKRDLFYKKAKFSQVTRNFLVERGFLEVETPSLEVTTGGAEARPFKTFHNDFDIDIYMRICVGELWQKRLMAAGFEKTFEIGRAYRNEGSSPFHLQEFTNCEFYWSYANYRDGIDLIKDLYKKIAIEVFETTKFNVFGYEFDLADDWREIEYVSEIEKRAGINIEKATDKELEEKLIELGVKYEGNNRERMTDSLWKYCRKQITGPAILLNHPKLVSPLSKIRKDGFTTERFRPIFAGVEVGNGFSEQNNPIGQRKAFEEQAELLKNGDEEAMMPDFEFVEMLEHGMPPTFGWGFGERMFSILAGVPIREAQLFPLVKPKKENE